MSEIRLPPEYPNKLCNRDLESEISKIQNYIANNSVKSLLTGHFAALGSGLAEKERRRQRKTTNLTLVLSGFSLIFALGAFCFSFADYKGDIGWQNIQIFELQKLNENLTNFTSP